MTLNDYLFFFSDENSIYYNKTDGSPVTEKSIDKCLPKTIQDVMKDVSVYVEVRSDSNNRTNGIKGVIAKLGAKVNERLTKYVFFSI